jgi:hypothetical protein
LLSGIIISHRKIQIHSYRFEKSFTTIISLFVIKKVMQVHVYCTRKDCNNNINDNNNEISFEIINFRMDLIYYTHTSFMPMEVEQLIHFF